MTLTSTLFFCDDDADFRLAMKTLLANPAWNFVEFSDAESAWEHLEQHPVGRGAPGCLILDLGLPGMSGLELLAKIRDAEFHIPVIMLTGAAEIPLAVEAMRNGAYDYLTKPFPAKVLGMKIERALDDCRKRQRSIERRTALRQRFEKLSPRELEVLTLICQGFTSKKVALDLSLSPKTIEVHRAHIMQKVDADSLAELVWLYTLAYGHDEASVSTKA